jgi:hypothetical protein
MYDQESFDYMLETLKKALKVPKEFPSKCECVFNHKGNFINKFEFKF